MLKQAEINSGLDFLFSVFKKIAKNGNNISLIKSRYIFRGVTKNYENLCIDNEKEDPPRYISSGAAVRLTKYRPNYKYSQYIDYVKSLVDEAKRNYPDIYKGENDIDILADIQHKGGGTCLVDFSKNVLITLWFICKEDQTRDGFLFCYDVYNDIIEKNNLSILLENDANRGIENLLLETQKASNFQGRYSYKFWMWEPSSINERISRQNSIFILGLEKFDISEHAIESIRVPKDEKRNILYILENFFDINGPTIYHDADGFANSNSKFVDFPISQFDVGINSYYDGFENMIHGHWNIAIDHFSQYEIIHKIDNTGISHVDLMELHFSKANCYKHIDQKRKSIIEYYNCIDECKSAIGLIDDETTDNDKKLIYLYQKRFKAYGELLQLYYELQEYDDAIRVINNILELIERFNNEMPQKTGLYSPVYCHFAKVEILMKKSIHKNIHKDNEIVSSLNDLEEEGCFYTVLKKFFILFYKILFEEESIDIKDVAKSLSNCVVEYNNNRDKKANKDEHYSRWNFNDIKKILFYKAETDLDPERNDIYHKLLYLVGIMENIQKQLNNLFLDNMKIFSDKS